MAFPSFVVVFGFVIIYIIVRFGWWTMLLIGALTLVGGAMLVVFIWAVGVDYDYTHKR